MKKIPTLFIREFENHKIVKVTPEVTPGMEWVLNGEGDATVKFDGSCCAIFDQVFYKRYDAKKGKPIPEGAIKCQEEPDPVTGHLPCWVRCDRDNPSDKWFFAAYDDYLCHVGRHLSDNQTYEAVGPHFQGNPHDLEYDMLRPHGTRIIDELKGFRTFESIREYLETHEIEGIVFWKDGEPKCKIKRSDFGYEWPPCSIQK